MKTGNPYPGPRPLTRDDPIYGRTIELRRLTNLVVAERIVLLYSPSGAGKTSLLQAGLLPRLDRAGYRILGPIRPGVGLEAAGAAVGNRYVAATVDALRDQTGLPLELPPGATLADCLTALGPPPPRPCRLGAQLDVTPASAGQRAEPKVTPASAGQRAEPEVTPASAGQRAEPEVTPASAGQRDEPEVTPASAGQRDEPKVTPASAGQRDEPKVTPASAGQRAEPKVTPASAGQPPARNAVQQKLWQADLLVFDQFEEVLLADPGDHRGRLEFFEQLGEVLRDRNRWALFSMREEHIAGLDVYRRPIPTQLRTTFRLDPLGIPEAIEAIRGPAERAGVAFPEEIAQRLAQNLAGVTETRDGAVGADGDGGLTTSRHWVEPVQLQVVCQRIWNKLGPHDTAITELTQIGTVDEALRGYYADSVRDAAQESGYRERKLREWVQDEMITPSGARNQVLWEKGPATAVRDSAIERLDRSHLVRAESRRDVLWIELAHDRLVKPVLEDNAAWLDRSLQPFQRRAQAWQRTGGADLLLTGQALAEAVAWAKDPDNRAELDDHPNEADFLKESRAAEQERLRKRRQRQLTIAAGVGLALMAIGVLAFFLVQADRASRQELSRRLGFDAVAVRNGQPSLALLLAANAFRAWDTFEARSSLVAALSPEGQPVAEFDVSRAGSSDAKPAGGGLAGTGETVANLTSVAVSPDGRWLASTARDGMVYVWDIAEKGRPNTVPVQGATGVEHLAYSPDGSMVAVGDSDGKVWLFAGRGPVLEPRSSFVAEPDTINSMAWGANGALYTLGKGDLAQWQVSEDSASEVVRWPAADARALAISPTGGFLAVAYEDGSVAEWRLDANGRLPAAPDAPLQGNSNTPSAIAVADTGEIAVAYENGLVVRWPRAGTPARNVRFTGSMDSLITGLAWSPGGKWLAASGRDHQALVWDVGKGGVAERWRGHTDAVQAIAFDPAGTFCFTAGQDGRVLKWPAPGKSIIGPFVRQFEGPRDELWTVAFSPENGSARLVATGTRDGEVRLWKITDASDVSSAVVGTGLGGVRHVAFSDDGAWLAAGDELGHVLLWGISDGAAVEPHTTFQHGDGFINGLVFSGDTLISAGQIDPGELDNYLKAWPLGGEQTGPLGGSEPVGLVNAMKKDGQGRIWVINEAGRLIAEEWRPASRIFNRTSDVEVSPKGAASPTSLAVLGAGDVFAFGTSEGRLVLARPPNRVSGIERTSLDAHRQRLSAVAFSPNGQLVATAGWDGQVMLWDLATRRRLGEPLNSGGLGISEIAFSKDGQWLAVAGDNRTLMLYPATPEQWVKAACASAGRGLTQEERDQYLDGKDARACSQ